MATAVADRATTATDTANPQRPSWTTKQHEAFGLLRDYSRILLYGGSSSGKTRVLVEFFAGACLEFPGLRGLFLRHRRQHAKESLWHESLLSEVLPRYPRESYEPNQGDLYIKFANGSEIWVSGTDDESRIEKVLGRGMGFIYLNEASQISYKAFTMVRTRLRQKIKGWHPRVAVDCNPPAPTHWTHRVFIDHREPSSGKNLDPTGYVALRLNPADNADNLPDGYMDELRQLPDAEWRRFGLGEWVKPVGAVFPEYGEHLLADDIPPCEKYVVGVDLVTYAAVLLGLQRYSEGMSIRHKIYIVDTWSRAGALAWEANEAITEKWSEYNYTAYIDHNLGQAGTREFDHSRLAQKGKGSVEAGIVQLQGAMHLEDFKVARHCSQLHYEMGNYRRDEAGAIVKADDHHIDALRMAIYSTIRKRRVLEGA